MWVYNIYNLTVTTTHYMVLSVNINTGNAPHFLRKQAELQTKGTTALFREKNVAKLGNIFCRKFPNILFSWVLGLFSLCHV